MTTLSLTPNQLTSTAQNVLVALGTPDDLARAVAASLVGAQLVGHDSHGVIRLAEYADFVARGDVVPSARPEVVSASGAVAMVDGHGGWGQVACRLAVDVAGRLARKNGVAAITVRHCNHIGRIGEYVELLAEEGLVGMAWCNADPAVAPFGGKARVLGTNPIAVSIPLAGDAAPVVMDFATSATAEGKLRVARATGSTIEPGLVVDVDGRPADTAEAFYAGGALVPFGGHKGYALSVIIEMLGGALSGNHPSSSPAYVTGNGVVLLALDPGSFVGREPFIEDVTACAETLRSSPPVDTDRPVLVPGDVENQQRRRRRGGVPVDVEIWRRLGELADRLGTVTEPRRLDETSS